MIPKIIHYCWFGGSELPKSALKYIESWKKFFPDYRIIEWNEQNYNVRKNRYISQAYDNKKYAFVSDYARFDILFQYGGIYFDTDVEVISSFSDIIERGAFLGCETDSSENGKMIQVNPGLGMGAEPGNIVIKTLLDYYNTLCFINSDGSLNTTTVVKYTTDILKKNGVKESSTIQSIGGFTIYPKEYFNPRDFETGKLIKTNSTRSIHWYSMSWMPKSKRFRSAVTRLLHRLFGVDAIRNIKERMKKR